jgi:hypothetical protein
MLGRTRLYQRTGSPLIQGSTGSRRRNLLPWLVAIALVVAAVWWYLTFMR